MFSEGDRRWFVFTINVILLENGDRDIGALVSPVWQYPAYLITKVQGEKECKKNLISVMLIRAFVMTVYER